MVSGWGDDPPVALCMLLGAVKPIPAVKLPNPCCPPCLAAMPIAPIRISSACEMVAVGPESSDVPVALNVWDWSLFDGISSPFTDKKVTAMFACVGGELVLEIVIV